MAKTMKVLDIHNGAINYRCIKRLDTNRNPYHLYRLEWRDGGWHRKQIANYQEFQCVMWHIMDIAKTEHWA